MKSDISFTYAETTYPHICANGFTKRTEQANRHVRDSSSGFIGLTQQSGKEFARFASGHGSFYRPSFNGIPE
jgi:hypothetical protein